MGMKYREEPQAHVAAWDMRHHNTAIVQRQVRDREAIRHITGRGFRGGVVSFG